MVIDNLDLVMFIFYLFYISKHLEIKDSCGITLAYWLWIPSMLTQTLQQSGSLIPPLKKLKYKQAESILRH